MSNPVQAIKNHYATLSLQEKQNLLNDFGIKNINELYIIRPEVAEKYCKTHNLDLGSVSVFWGKKNDADTNYAEEKYNEAKDKWENEYNKYQVLKKGYAEQKTQQNAAYNKYVTLLTKQQNGESGVTSSNVSDALKSYNLLSQDVKVTGGEMDLSLAMQREHNSTQRRFMYSG